MRWRLPITHWFIKRFILVSITGWIVIGSFSSWAFALTFDPVQNLSANVTGSAFPQIVANASNIYVVWQAQVLGISSTVFRRSVKTPDEKRMKSGFANSCAIASTSSLQKERRMSRSVSSCMVGTPRCPYHISLSSERHSDTQFAREVRFLERCERTKRNTRDQRSRQIHQVSPPCGKRQLIALPVICTN